MFHLDAFTAPAQSTGTHARHQPRRDESSGQLLTGCSAGAVAALIGAGCWAIIAGVAGMQLGWVAVPTGFLVGYAVRFAGQGDAPVFGFAAMMLAVTGCILGNIFGVIYLATAADGLSYADAISALEVAEIIGAVSSHFKRIDVIFYAISAYLAFTIAYGNERDAVAKKPRH